MNMVKIEESHCNFRIMSQLVITSCTGRKRIIVDQKLQTLPSREAVELHGNGVDALAHAWVEAINGAPKSCLAIDLYAGRSFVDACAVARLLNARLKVVSAGLGLVDSADMITSYELTISDEQSSLPKRLATYSALPVQWWSALNKAHTGHEFPIALSTNTDMFQRIYIALPSRYLEMIRLDLSSISAESIEKLRIFTSPAGQKLVPAALHKAVMPYDERLEDINSLRRGTRTDFAQRAMRHFVEDLGADTLSLDEARATVIDSMAKMSYPAKPVRRRVSDDEIATLLHANWLNTNGQSSRLLRYLRDEALVSCEQGRFRDIWLKVRDTIAKQSE